MLTKFGKALYKMLIDKDMRPKDLAEAMGCSTARISIACHDTGLRISRYFIDDLEATRLFSHTQILELRQLENAD